MIKEYDKRIVKDIISEECVRMIFREMMLGMMHEFPELSGVDLKRFIDSSTAVRERVIKNLSLYGFIKQGSEAAI